MNAPPTRARPSLLLDDSAATTKGIVESIGAGSYRIRRRRLGRSRLARRRLDHAGLGRADRGGLRRPQVQQLVDAGRDDAAGERADVPDPPVRPVVADELRPE